MDLNALQANYQPINLDQQIQQPFAPPQSQGILSRIIGGITTPFKTLGKAITSAPAAIGREFENKPINDIQQNVFGTTDSGQIAKKIIGSTAQVGSFLIPGGEEAGLIGKAGLGVAQGASFGSGGALANNGRVSDVLKAGLTGGLTGGLAAPVGSALLGKILPESGDAVAAGEEAAASKLSGRAQALLQTNGLNENNIAKYGLQRTTDAAQNVIDMGAKGSNIGKIVNYLQPATDKLEGQISNKLADSAATFSKQDVLDSLQNTFDKSAAGSGVEGEALAGANNQLQLAKNLVNNANEGDSLSSVELNKVKQELGSFNNWQKTLSPNAADTIALDVNHNLYGALNDSLKEANPGVGDLLSKTSLNLDSMKMLTGAGGTRGMFHFPLVPMRVHSPVLNSIAESAQDKIVRALNPGATTTIGRGVTDALETPVGQAVSGATSDIANKFVVPAAVSATEAQPNQTNPENSTAPVANPTGPQPVSQPSAVTKANNSFGLTQDQLSQAMMADLTANGGKNLSKLKTLYDMVGAQEKANTKAPSVSMQNKTTVANSAINGLNDLNKAFSTTNLTGAGILSKVAQDSPLGATSLKQIDDMLPQIAADVAKATGAGTAKDIMAMLPSVTDSPASAKAKIANLQGQIVQYVQEAQDQEKQQANNSSDVVSALLSNLSGAGS